MEKYSEAHIEFSDYTALPLLFNIFIRVYNMFFNVFAA